MNPTALPASLTGRIWFFVTNCELVLHHTAEFGDSSYSHPSLASRHSSEPGTSPRVTEVTRKNRFLILPGGTRATRCADGGADLPIGRPCSGLLPPRRPFPWLEA